MSPTYDIKLKYYATKFGIIMAYPEHSDFIPNLSAKLHMGDASFETMSIFISCQSWLSHTWLKIPKLPCPESKVSTYGLKLCSWFASQTPKTDLLLKHIWSWLSCSIFIPRQIWIAKPQLTCISDQYSVKDLSILNSSIFYRKPLGGSTSVHDIMIMHGCNIMIIISRWTARSLLAKVRNQNSQQMQEFTDCTAKFCRLTMGPILRGGLDSR